ncbi:hypothetical protein ABGB09_29560 [Streptomyces sp. B8F3]|uniref:hypothetical protein n=1 Tax=Streptomyces sp. B8F3 TaxID=3153573 RepID=UPI00325CDD8F
MTTPQQPSAPSAEDFLMGGGVASAKFPTIGAAVSGRITERPVVEQQRDFTTGELKFWDDGKPMQQLVVTLATAERDPANPEDDGTRRLYVKGQMKNAVAQAVRTAGARGLEVGGVLSVTYARDGQKTNPRFNAPKNYEAQYTPAASAELNTPDPGTAPALPAANAGPAVPGLTAEQAAAAQANPATAALVQQIQQAQPSGQAAVAPGPASGGELPPF